MKATDRLYPHFMRLITVRKLDNDGERRGLWLVSYETDHIEYLPNGDQNEYDKTVSVELDDLMQALRELYQLFKVDYADYMNADFEAMAAKGASDE